VATLSDPTQAGADRGPGSSTPRKRSFRPLALLLAAAAMAVILIIAFNTGGSPPAPPGPPAPGQPAPTGPRVLFSDTFDDGNWCNFERVQNRFYSDTACGYRNNAYALTNDNGAARFEVRPGDSIGGGLGNGERSELSEDSAPWEAHSGDRWFVHERLRLSTTFQPSDSWTIITQFHAGSDSPPLSLQVAPSGALILHAAGPAGDANDKAGKGDRILVPPSEFMGMRGQWFEVDLVVQWSPKIGKGGTAAYVNGNLVAPWRTQQTMASSRCYWKGGIYRAPTDSTAVLWMDDVRITAS
jgi:Polysaccharide lyase